MPKTTSSLDLSTYTPVAERIRRFYERYPSGRIVTELVSSEIRDGATIVTFRALAFRDASDERAAATGWASERDDDGEVNAVACLENAETSAIGRALANLGFAAGARPSREEMEKAQRGRARVAERSVYPSKALKPYTAPVPREVRGLATRGSIAEIDSLAAELERAEVEPLRIRRLRQRLAGTRPSGASLVRVERVLRRWLASLDE
ncbi:MAG TPA: hypothetical protein VJW73_17195 [Gemmatimonadaceae bacterium]|nr:hypothetical protein [Gemmatimonadaceae bacterium]